MLLLMLINILPIIPLCRAQIYTAPPIRPDANGDVTHLWPYPSGLSNYQCVDDEVADDDTTYVHSTELYGNPVCDLYQLSSVDLPYGYVIWKVIVYARVKSYSSSVPNSFRTLIKTHGQVYEGTWSEQPASWGTISTEYANNPYTNSRWTKDEVDALQAGIDIYKVSPWIGGPIYNGKCTQVWVEVQYHYHSGGSCPFIYSWDGQQYHFDHEAYPFAVMKSAETTSYDRLKYLKEVDGEYKLKIKQVLHEIDWTDSFELYVVDHPDEDSFVMPDLQGNLHTVKELIQPITAYEKNGDDCLEYVKYLDDKIWKDSIFDADVNDESTLRNWVVLTFPKPEGVTEAKLLLSVKKQVTITYEWEFFINVIGENYWDSWQKVMENPVLTNLFMEMLEREIKLRIEVWNGAEWILQNSISAGDSIWDDFLVVLDISDVEGDELQIRLKSTTAHYKINYVGIDYSEDEPMIVYIVDPYYAVKNGEEDVLATLEKSDEKYVTLLPNDVIELRYNAIPKSEWKRDFTIATKGYYNFVDFQDQTFSGFLEGITLWLKGLTEPYFVPKTVFPYLQEPQ